MSFTTIVSGLPRSGTSMMMRMLEAGGMPVIIDEIRQADDDNPRGYYEFEQAKKTKEDPSWLEDSRGKSAKMVYKLLYTLPAQYSYRVLFMRREMEEVLVSQQKMLQRSGNYGAGLSDKVIAQLFSKEIARVQDWLKQQPNFEVLYVDYNEMVESPQQQVAQINRLLGGTLDEAAMRQIVEPSLYRNRVLVT